jgi:Domain of unknown function (DUF1707)
MDDRIRVSDADRDHVTARLRDHFAQGRLTPDELDERLSAALSAKTVGDLRHVMADLPEPRPVAPRSQWAGPQWAGPHRVARRYYRPRVLPLVLLVLFASLLMPGGGWFLFAFFRVILLVWLVTFLAGTLFGVVHRRAHRYR